MAELEALFRAVDELSPDELKRLQDYIDQRRRLTWWVVPPDNLQKVAEVMRPVHEDAAPLTEEEINGAIDEAVAEVRRERKDQSRD